MPLSLLRGHPLALCLLFGLAATPAAAETPPCPKVADALSGVTVWPRGQLGLKLDGSDTPILWRWREKVGIRLEEVDRFALVRLDEGSRQVLVVRTTKPVNQGGVMLACEVGTPCGRRCGRMTYTGRSGLGAAFPEPTLAVIADCPATLEVCLAELRSLCEHLEQGGKHDLTAWARAVPYKQGERRTSCYRAAPPAKPHMVLKTGTDLDELPLPPAVRMARLAVDVGEVLQVQAELECDGAEGAREVAEVLQGGVDIARGSLIGYYGLLRAIRWQPGIQHLLKELPLPLDLVAPTERALAEAQATVKGKKAVVCVRAHMSGKRIGAAVKKVMDIPVLGILEEVPGPGLFFTSALRERKPQVAEPEDAEKPVCVPAPVDQPAAWAVPPPAAPADKVTLTVANVRHEEVRLFKYDSAGDLTFVCRLPAGDAVDVSATVGERWVAMEIRGTNTVPVPGAPKEEEVRLFKHTVSGQRPTWLLRR